MQSLNRALVLIPAFVIFWYSHAAAAVDFQKHVIDETVTVIQQIATWDMDHDGDQDIIGATWDMADDASIIWWENFGLPDVMIKHPINLDPWVTEHIKSATSVQAADLNNDGQIEIVSANRFTGIWDFETSDRLVLWWKEEQSDLFVDATVDSFANTISSRGFVLVADMDQDGDQDIIYCRIEKSDPYWPGSEWNIKVYLYGNQNNGTVFNRQVIDDSFSSLPYLDWEVNPRLMAVGDLDNDGDNDLLLTCVHNLLWLRNDGTLSFTPIGLNPGMYSPTRVFMQDIDLDSDMDICCASLGEMVWLSNDGAQQFSIRSFGVDVGGAADVLFADLDQDSDMDVVLVRSNYQGLAWLENDGSQNYVKHNIGPGTYFWNTGTGVLLDVDADGDQDVFQASWLDSLKVWEHVQPTSTPTATVSPTFTPSPTISATGTVTLTRTASATVTPTFTASPVYSRTSTPTITETPTVTPTSTPTGIPNEIYVEERISRETNWQDGEYVWITIPPGPGYPGGGYWYKVSDYGTDVSYTWHDDLSGLPYDDPVSVITGTSEEGWGKVLSPNLQCDVDYYPLVEVSVVGISPAPHATWKIGIQEMEGAFRYWDLSASSMDTGTFVFNYRDITGLSGQSKFVIQLTIESAAGRWFKVDYVRVYHDGPVFSPTPTYTPTATATPTRTFTITPTPNPYDAFHEAFTGGDGTPVAEWEDEEENGTFNATLKYINNGFYGCLSRTAESNWGKALSPHIRCDVDAYPLLEVRVVNILPHVEWEDSGTRWKLGIQELEGAYRYWDITNSMKSTGVFMINYALLTELSGMSEFAVQLTVEGGSAAAVQFDYVRIYSENPPTFTPTATQSPTITETPTISPTATESATFTVSATCTESPTITCTATISETITATPTATESPTAMPTATPTPSPSLTATFAPTRTGTATATATPGWELEAGRVVAYPNPARGSVHFGYYAVGEVRVVIDIYRLTGERVATIVDLQNGGNGRTLTTRWVAADIAAGVYFYRLVIRDANGRETMVKQGKIALLR